MIANIVELVEIQKLVNKKVMEKLEEPVTGDQFVLAFNVELFEYFNAIGVWKWWKHNHEMDRVDILDELADCFAFFLSTVILESEMNEVATGQKDFVEKVEQDINIYLEKLSQYEFDIENKNKTIVDLITYVGTDNEVDGVQTIERFSIAIFIATVLFEEITWEEISEAYKEKSAENIARQERDY